MSSKIEWTGSTWNPIRARNRETGAVGTVCRKISPGCANCYAERHNARLLPAGSSGLPYTAAGVAGAEIFIDPKILAEPLRRRKPDTFFVCSMTDLFMEEHTFEMIAALFGVMAATPQHTYQVLTKRPERAREFFAWLASPDRWEDGGEGDCIGAATIETANLLQEPIGTSKLVWALPNVWIGVSVESQAYLHRLDTLVSLPAAVRFASLEPLLEDLGDLGRWLGRAATKCPACGLKYGHDAAIGGTGCRGLDWAIVGGESGPGARPCDVKAVRSIMRQCQDAGVAVFVKQLGSYAILDARYDRSISGATRRLHDRKGGNPTEWPEDLRIREMPRT